MQELVAAAAVIIAGPLVGLELGVAAVINPLAAELPDEAFRSIRGGGSRLLGALMPFWYISTVIVLVAWATISGAATAITAAIVMVVVLLATSIS